MSESDAGWLYVCPNGHVHVTIPEDEVTLTPKQARDWVEMLYDASKEAEEQ